MALSDYFCHRCTIQRFSIVRGTSGEETPAWADHIMALPCRFVVQDERVASPQGLLVLTTYRLLVECRLDIRAGDRASEIIMDDLSTEGPFTIKAVIPRLGQNSQSHITLRLEKVE
ncbi:MAG: hypothetical protein EHM48_01750 [Planctomycetaceae bacterium]|nr:MAG: hypothetical protein EHM48_01750 [Planctomycetaceae bacterium]